VELAELRKDCERETARKKLKSVPLFCGTFLDLGQSANGANPNGWAKEQPLKTRRAADIILLECSEEKERACSGMQWSGKRTIERSEMKRYCGCRSPTERRK
jgi:ribosomal protein L33